MRRGFVLWLLAVACRGEATRPPSCDEVKEHHDALYSKLDQRERGKLAMHALEITRRCATLTEAERRCVVATRSYDETVACIDKATPGVERKVGDKSSAKPRDFIALATAETAPRLLGPFDGIEPSPSRTVRGLDPRLCKQDSIIPAWCEYKADEFPDTILRVFRNPALEGEDGDHPLGTIRVTVPGRREGEAHCCLGATPYGR